MSSTLPIAIGSFVSYEGGTGMVTEIDQGNIVVTDTSTNKEVILDISEVQAVPEPTVDASTIKNLWHALALVREAIGFVPKLHVTTLGYSVQSFDAIMTRFNRACNAYGVVMSVQQISTSALPRQSTQKQDKGPNILVDMPALVMVEMQYTFRCWHHPEAIEVCTMSGAAFDAGDKALAKAITSSTKSLLRTMFSIPCLDEGDKDPASPNNTKDRPSSRPTPPAKQTERGTVTTDDLASLCRVYPQTVTDECQKQGIRNIAAAREYIKTQCGSWPRIDLAKAVKQFAETLQGGEKK